MRRLIAFSCENERLVGTLDAAAGSTGLLIVSGGNEVRAGTHRGMAALAQLLAARGVPVFRFDRRGVGDSRGRNAGWEASAPDIAAAAAAFRREQPHLTRVMGLGNCDAATALALFAPDSGIDALVLTNPWLGGDDPLPPPAAVRAHYARRLLDPAVWRRLATGGIDLGKLARGLRRSAGAPARQPLAARVAAGVAALPTTVVTARGDRTAQQFRAALPSVAVVELPTASHSFADAGDALADAIVGAVTT